MFLVGNINHPNVAYFQCVLGFEIEWEFPVHVYICIGVRRFRILGRGEGLEYWGGGGGKFPAGT